MFSEYIFDSVFVTFQLVIDLL